MTKILVQGDLHGNSTALYRALGFAEKYGCSAVYQVGDFGFGWEGNRSAPWDPWCDRVGRAATNYNIPVYWIDGNHENFDKLELVKAFGAPGPVEMVPNVFYVPRGTLLEIDGVRILAIGGAYSVDKDYRVWGRSWWPQEEITGKDLDRCYDIGKVDIVLSHDAPDEAFRAALMIAVGRNSLEMAHLAWKNDMQFPGAKPNRMALQSVLESACPKLWLHGHYHAYYEADLQNGTHVVGLDMECEENSWKVVDLADYIG